VVLTVGLTVALMIGAIVLYPYGLAAIALCTVVIYAIGFVLSNAILARKLGQPLLEIILAMRAAVIISAVVGAIWIGFLVAAPGALDHFAGAAAMTTLCAAAFAALFFLCPRWFLGEELDWLHAMALTTTRRLVTTITARRRPTAPPA
jgi:hypothetical protein